MEDFRILVKTTSWMKSQGSIDECEYKKGEFRRLRPRAFQCLENGQMSRKQQRRVNGKELSERWREIQASVMSWKRSEKSVSRR